MEYPAPNEQMIPFWPAFRSNGCICEMKSAIPLSQYLRTHQGRWELARVESHLLEVFSQHRCSYLCLPDGANIAQSHLATDYFPQDAQLIKDATIGITSLKTLLPF